MCTVTILPRPGGLRLLTNRDESRRRSEAKPPHIRGVQRGEKKMIATRAMYPTDADAGGTWVAVNTAGVVFTLLNRNLPAPTPTPPPPVDPSATAPTPTDQPPAPSGRRSRGEIIPALLDCESADAAIERLPAFHPRDFSAFRMVVADEKSIVVVRTDTLSMAHERCPLSTKPSMFTSSGLGDHLVDPPRRALFNSWFTGDSASWPERQDAFHRHRWEDRPELSVCMSRSDARTVSLTAVEVEPGGVGMLYHAGPPCEPAEDTLLELPR